jgi:dihydroanticapsin dehydrogenase
MGGREAQRRSVETHVPLQRQGTPADIAPMFVYLMSDESAYVTAQSIMIDGGLTS